MSTLTPPLWFELAPTRPSHELPAAQDLVFGVVMCQYVPPRPPSWQVQYSPL